MHLCAHERPWVRPFGSEMPPPKCFQFGRVSRAQRLATTTCPSLMQGGCASVGTLCAGPIDSHANYTDTESYGSMSRGEMWLLGSRLRWKQRRHNTKNMSDCISMSLMCHMLNRLTWIVLCGGVHRPGMTPSSSWDWNLGCTAMDGQYTPNLQANGFCVCFGSLMWHVLGAMAAHPKRPNTDYPWHWSLFGTCSTTSGRPLFEELELDQGFLVGPSQVLVK